MKKTWKYLIPILFGIIVIGFLAYLIIPMLSGIVTLLIVGAIIAGLLVIVKKNFRN